MYINSYSMDMAARTRIEDLHPTSRQQVSAVAREHARLPWLEASLRRWEALQGTGPGRRALRLGFALVLALVLTLGLAPTAAARPLIYPEVPITSRPLRDQSTRPFWASYSGTIGSRDRTQVYDAYRAAYDYTR